MVLVWPICRHKCLPFSQVNVILFVFRSQVVCLEISICNEHSCIQFPKSSEYDNVRFIRMPQVMGSIPLRVIHPSVREIDTRLGTGGAEKSQFPPCDMINCW